MPSAYQNFTTPEWEEENAQPGQAQTFDRFGWGGRGNDIDPNTGEEIRGTSGLARDVNRYQGMAATPTYTSGPTISQNMSNQSRGVVMGGLGMLGSRAMGRTPSVAEQAGTAQAEANAAGLQSMGATMRGPGFARVAAARLARRQGQGVMQRQVGANLATRAGEMADSREALVGATGAMRQQDIGLSKEQAQLHAQQRAANDQREGYYEDLAHDSKTAELGARLGRSASEQAANAAANQQARQSEAQREQNTREDIATGSNALSGAVQGYIKSNGTGSEEKTKMNVKPLSRVKARARSYDRSMFERNNDDPNTHEAVDGGGDKRALDAAIAKSVGSEIEREDPYAPKAAPARRFGTRSDMMDHPDDYERGALGAPKGYARAYKPGPDTISTKFTDDGDLAPGTADAEHGNQGEYKDEYSRLISLSPGEAKEEIRPLSGSELRENESKLKNMSLQALPAGAPVSAVPALASHVVGRKADVKEAQEKVDALEKGRRTRAAEETAAAEEKRIRDKYKNEDMAVEAITGPIAGPLINRALYTFSPGETKKEVRPLFGRQPREGVDESYGHGDFMPTPSGGKYVTNRTGMHKATDDAKREAYRIDPAHHGESVDDDTHFDADNGDTYSKVDPKEWRSDDELKADAENIKRGYAKNLERGPSTQRVSDAQARKLSSEADDMMASMRFGLGREAATKDIETDEAPPDLSSAANARDKDPMAGALRALQPYEYEYKDGFREAEGQQPGEKNVGPMADEMDRDKVARTALTRDPRTGLRAIDLKKGLKLALGGLGHIQSRIDRLEGKRA